MFTLDQSYKLYANLAIVFAGSLCIRVEMAVISMLRLVCRESGGLNAFRGNENVKVFLGTREQTAHRE